MNTIIKKIEKLDKLSEKFKKIGSKKELSDLLNILINNISGDNFGSFSFKDHCFSHSIPNYSSICRIYNFLKEHNLDKVLEIGSGTGFWAFLIQLVNNLDIKKSIKGTTTTISTPKLNFIATEYKVPGSSLIYTKQYTKIENIDANEAIKKYEDFYCLFLCWPPKSSRIKSGEYDASEIIKKFRGKYIILITPENIKKNEYYVKYNESKVESEIESESIISGNSALYELLTGDEFKEINRMENMNVGRGKDQRDYIYFYKRIKPVFMEKREIGYIVDEMRTNLLRGGSLLAQIHAFQEEPYRYFPNSRLLRL